jgi:AcrR family transcriptional regulator
VRETNRTRTTATILSAARREIAEHGGSGLSMRAVARQVGMVSSAVYRYFPTREALVSTMIIESYGNLAAALAEVTATDPAARWRELARAMRAWTLANPHEFQLIYGTPIPGYVAPPETIPAAASAARPFLEVGSRHAVGAFDERRLTAQMGEMTALVAGAQPSGAAAVLAELAALVGMLTLELAGHFVGSADPADHLVEALLDRQVATLGLTS